MICDIHKMFFPQAKCPICERERTDLELAIHIAEIENRQPIVLWEGNEYVR